MDVKQKILDEGRVVGDVVVGVHGADEIVAGSMIGETGKYIAMANYGNPIWKPTFIYFYDNGIRLSINGSEFLYSEIYNVGVVEKKLFKTIIGIETASGQINFKTFHDEAIATAELIIELKNQYVEKQPEREDFSPADELLKYADLYERGFLTEEEFKAKKEELLKNSESEDESSEDEKSENKNQKQRFCTNCGTPVDENSNFCMNCGEKLI